MAPLTLYGGGVAQPAIERAGFTLDTILDDLQQAAGEGVTRVDWDLNLVGTPIPDQIAALKALAGHLR